jgi:hypothetical protein
LLPSPIGAVWAEAATGAETALVCTGDVLKLRRVAGTSPGKVPATLVGDALGIHSIGTVVQENLAAADGEPAHTGTGPDSIRWVDEAAGAMAPDTPGLDDALQVRMSHLPGG